MKRLRTVGAVTALAIGVLFTAPSLAFASTVNSHAQPSSAAARSAEQESLGTALHGYAQQSSGADSHAWLYGGSYYSGNYFGVAVDGAGAYFGWGDGGPVESLINHTGRSLCGTSAENQSIHYTFWAGGAWAWIGYPFSSQDPLDIVYWC